MFIRRMKIIITGKVIKIMENNIIDIKDRLSKTTSYVRDCQSRVNQGEIMDLQGLDKNVGSVCDDILKLPQDEGLELQVKMEHLIQSLEELSGAIQELQETEEDA